MKNLLLAFLLLVMASVAQGQAHTPQQVVDDFYQAYFERIHQQQKLVDLEIGYSSAFAALIVRNATVCEAHGEGPCGWGSYGDEHFQGAQEYESRLSLERAGYRSEVLDVGAVRVRFNIYPSIKNAHGFYEVDMTYQMILEDGEWRVDDIRYRGGHTARGRIKAEIESLLAN